jgi:flagellar motor switch protein FliN/FliY
MMELAVFNTDGTHEAAFAKLLLVVPVNAPPVLKPTQAAAANAQAGDTPTRQTPAVEPRFLPSSEASDGETDSAAALVDESGASFAATVDADAASNTQAAAADAALRALRIMRVPVTVSVRLAERKMSLGAVVALVPGSLVTFNKSCEDLLDLYVNNHRYCQGEAIKIGESFGLKISKVGVTEEPKQRII